MKKLFSLLTLALLTMSAWAATEVTIDFSQQEYSNEQVVESLTVDDVTLTFDQGTHATQVPKYFTSGTAIRIYAGNTMTVSAAEPITKIEFTFVGSNYTWTSACVTEGAYDNGIWAGSAQSIKFTNAKTGTNNQVRIVSMVVTLGGEVVEVINAPTLPAPRDFEDNFEVSITNNTEGATVKYSTDSMATWQDYSTPFTITETTTVYAKAVKGNNESSVVSAKYTKLNPIPANELRFLPVDFTNVTETEFTLVKEPVTIYCSKGTVTDDQFRIFKDSNLNFTSSDADIIKIEFTCTAKGTAKYGPGCFAAQAGYTYETDGYIGTWVGKAKTVSFTAETNQVRATQIVVTLDDGSTVVVAAPTFDPAAKEFEESITVAITAEDGAAIKYNYDNGETWNDYTTPLTLTETTTVYAKAVKGDVESTVAHATYTKVEPSTGITTLAQANALPDNTEFTFEGTGVVVTYQTANKQYTFLRDATGYGNFYQADTTNMNNMPALQNGQVLNPNWTATKTTFRNLPEYKNASNVSASTNTDAELAAPIEISALADSMINAYVTVKNIKKFAVSGKNITITLADGTMVGYNQFNINLTDLPTTEGDYTAIGIVGKYNSNRQLWLISWEGQGTPEPEPTEVGDLATANAVEDGIKITYLNDVAATYQHGNYLFIRDEDGNSGLIYGAVDATFETGDVLGADWTATKTTYHGAPQFINPNGVTNSGDTWTVEPNEHETLTADNVHEYVIVKGQTITACTDTTNQYMAKTFYNGDGMVLFNQFGVDMSGIEEGKTYDVVGIANLRDGEVQMYIISVTEATAAGLRGDVDNSGNVDISDATALINYLLYGNSEGLNMDNANCDLTGGIDISDATTLINYLLYGTW